MKDTRAYLAARLDQLSAANRDDDEPTATRVIADIIEDDHPGARQAIADALRLRDARGPEATTTDDDG